MLTGSLPRYTFCALSIETTRRCSVISFTECVLGTSSSMPDCRMGAVIMKMIRRTSTMSMNGTMLISEREVCVDLEREGILEVHSRQMTVKSEICLNGKIMPCRDAAMLGPC